MKNSNVKGFKVLRTYIETLEGELDIKNNTSISPTIIFAVIEDADGLQTIIFSNKKTLYYKGRLILRVRWVGNGD